VEQRTSVSWSELTAWRSECFERFGSIHDVPIVDHSRELKRLTAEARRLLDFGASADHPLKRTLDPDRTAYWSLDPDPVGSYDFADLSDVPDDLRFDLVVADQVLEHVPLGDSITVVTGIAAVLEPGGRFVATVPNASHPVRHWGDATHVTPWPVFDLYGLFRVAGLEVESLARYGKRRLSWRPVRRLIVRAVASEFRVDWCDSLMIVGRRPG
jgi:hypothetical protein